MAFPFRDWARPVRATRFARSERFFLGNHQQAERVGPAGPVRACDVTLQRGRAMEQRDAVALHELVKAHARW
jgi:hypothetical protein